MKLLIDIGNTHIVSSISENDKLVNSFRVPTTPNLTEDVYSFYLESFLHQNHTNIFQIKKIILCSVVPALHKIFLKFSEKYSIPLFDIGKASNLSFDLPYSLEERASDRVAIIEGVIGYYNVTSFIAIDFGTATTIDLIIDKRYLGGNIIPGFYTAFKALSEKTALIGSTEIIPTEKVYGISLQEQLSAGILHGYIGQIRYIISKILQEFPNIPIFATGGVSTMITPHVGNLWIDDKFLLEKGMHYIEKRASGNV